MHPVWIKIFRCRGTAVGLAGALLLLAGLALRPPLPHSPDVLTLQRSQALQAPVAYGPPLPVAVLLPQAALLPVYAPPAPQFQVMLSAVFAARSPADLGVPAGTEQAQALAGEGKAQVSGLSRDRRRGIRFAPGSLPITLRIEAPATRSNQEQAVEITFMPGKTCSFGDGQACVYTFTAQNGMPIIYLTIHSGVGGEGQAFRHAVEGTGLNRAANSIPEIQANLAALVGARVVLAQGSKTRRQFELVGLGRLPPDRMAAYIAAPVEGALSLAAETIPAFKAYLAPESPLIIFETCGWKVNGEPGAAQASATSGSVYIGIIQENP